MNATINSVLFLNAVSALGISSKIYSHGLHDIHQSWTFLNCVSVVETFTVTRYGYDTIYNKKVSCFNIIYYSTVTSAVSHIGIV